jgi:hypothetical protein
MCVCVCVCIHTHTHTQIQVEPKEYERMWYRNKPHNSKLHMIYIYIYIYMYMYIYIYICIYSNNGGHPVTKNITTLHCTCLHFTSSHLNFTQLHFILALPHLNFLPLHFTSQHYTSPHCAFRRFHHTSIPFISIQTCAQIWRILKMLYLCFLKVPYCSWLRHCTTSWKVVGLIHDSVTGIFRWRSFWPHVGPGVDSAKWVR